MNTNDLRQPNALEDYMSTQAISSKLVAAKAEIRLEEYRPDPLTGRQRPGTSVLFGLPNLDDIMIMLKGCYYLVAARPRTGKSAFAMQVVDEAIRQLANTDRIVVIFSAEMDAATLANREACAAEGLSYWRMVQGKLSQAEYDRIAQRLRQMGGKRFVLDESSSPTIEHMAAQLSTLVANGTRIGLVMFDYLQLGGEMDRDESRRINKISRGLKGLAKKFDCPVLALSQLNRDIERRREGQAQLADLMYGGEADPDGIIVLSRPWLQDQTKPKELVEVWVVKHRHGPGGYCMFSFDEQVMRFRPAILRKVPLNEDSPDSSVRDHMGRPERPAPGKGVPVRTAPPLEGGLRTPPFSYVDRD